MKVRAQIGMVLNLDKCIGCHTCSVTCKNVWTSRPGMEYAWFNNVETKPGIGYPKEWENQDKWNGGWVRKANGRIEPRQGGKWKLLMKIFANPNLPQIDDYYEPFTFDYDHLQSAPEMKASPTARPRSLITGMQMDKIVWGPNWEEILGGEFSKRSADKNFDGFDAMQKAMVGEFENTFMMYLPRLCEHCLNPACVASCPSGSIYKREEDGIVLIDQDKCQGKRECVKACPYKKIYFNATAGRSQKCIFCFPRVESGVPPACARQCPGRLRFVGMLDDSAGPIHRLVNDYKVALPLHPEYGTGPNVYYVPPVLPPSFGPDGRVIDDPRIPTAYLRSLFGPGVDAALATIRAEMERRQRGEPSELMDLLVARDWKTLFNIPEPRHG
ncbi:MAG: nitrate reductase subunit beta [Rubrivivax sp.]|nr:nitrate reductase subunit beta [Rubrivivax sp.]